MAKILITGGSGLVGKAITESLRSQNHEVAWLSRKAGITQGIREYRWDINAGYIDPEAFDGVLHVIHLAGASIIGKRWTKNYKRLIIDSRVKSSALLHRHISSHNVRLGSFTGASAVGYYGAIKSDHVFKEADPPGNDFLAKVCVEWEKSYQPFIASGIRTSVLRTAVVLDRHDGALKKMLLPFRMGLGAAVADGKQQFPWIHMKDLGNLYAYVTLNEKISGVYNAVAPELVNNHTFSGTLAGVLSRPFWLPPIPAGLVKLALGEAATTLTTGVKVSDQKIITEGFVFRYPELQGALADLLIKRST